MKGIFAILFIAISTLVYSQDFNFKPKWNRGEERIITITQVDREFEDDILIEESTTTNQASLKVIKDSKESYTLEAVFENQAWKAASEFYDKLGDELQEYQDLKLIISVNKQSAEIELLNWKDAQKFMNDSFDQISNLLEEKIPDDAELMNFVFSPIKALFISKENIEGYMLANLDFMFIPFNKNFIAGETISETESQENPFNAMQEISATTLLTLESLDENSKTCIINQEIQLDLREFIEMIKDMMMKMAESFGANDSIAAQKGAEMDEFEMDIENKQVITFNYGTSWVTGAVGIGRVTGMDPTTGINSLNESITTITVK
jgi:hypothetical protein